MQTNEISGPVDIAALIERLDTAYHKGELSGADRILEFPQVLRALKKVYTLDLMEDRKRHARVYRLIEELLDDMIEYKVSLIDPEALTLYRPRSPARQRNIIHQLKAEMRQKRRKDNGEDDAEV